MTQQFIQHQRKSIEYTTDEQYLNYEEKHGNFFTKLLLKYLLKKEVLKVRHVKTEVINWTKPKQAKLIDHIRESIDELVYGLQYNKSIDDYALLVGEVEMYELFNETYNDSIKPLIDIRYGIDGQTYHLYGIPVNVVNNVSGFAIVDKKVLFK